MSTPCAVQADVTVALTEAQLGLWYAQQLDPDNPIFNVAHAFHLTGALEVDVFIDAVNQMVAEADALALAIVDDADGPRQQVDEARRPWLEVVDVSGEADPETQARALMTGERATPRDPSRDALACNRLYVLGDNRHLWYCRIHHLVIDGVGLDILCRRVAAIYNATLQGADSGRPLPALERAFVEDDKYRQSTRREKDKAYWQTLFQDVPDVVGMAAGRAVTARSSHRVERRLDAETARALRTFSAAENISWPDVLTAITALYCQRMTARTDTVIGAPYMARFGHRAAGVPTMLMNVLPVPLALDESRPLAALCTDVAQALREARKHGRYRSEQLRRDFGLLGGERRLHGALVNVLPFRPAPELDGVRLDVEVLATGPVDDITLTLRGDLDAACEASAAGVVLEAEANPELYSSADTLAHIERLLAFVAAALSADTLASVPTATPDEAQWAIEQCNATEHDVPDTTLVALLEHAMAATPAAPAVVFEDHTLSYAELDRRSGALAQQLVARGVGTDDIVAVMLPRSVELIVALVAILRAGAAYLPLDLDHPRERTARLLARADAHCLLAFDDALEAGEFDLRCLPVSAWPMRGEQYSAQAVAPDAAAYVIFTSGSTGEPKGVMVEHSAIVNRLLWMQAQYGVDASDVILQKTPVTFDVSVWELFLPLISGARLAMAPPGAHHEPRAMVECVRRHNVSIMHFVPSMLAAFLAEPMARNLSVQQVFCSGEALSATLRERFHDSQTAVLHNLYGPTEAAVDVSYWAASRDDHSQPLPIGFPVWNTRLYVLDHEQRALPAGVAGELYIAGRQLARGYLGQPELTAARFVADPFQAGARMYKTGDRALQRDDGAIVYLGRDDAQVKIRGLRIEPGEVEAAVSSSAQIKQCCVVPRTDQAITRLVCYVVVQADFDETALRGALAKTLPDYMVPAAFVVLDALPLTANGKLDIRALPAPQFEQHSGRALRTATEHRVATLFAEVLHLAHTPNADGDFFRLGGDSLLAVELMLRIREAFGDDPGLGALFAHPRVAALATVVDAPQADADNGLAPILTLAHGAADVAPRGAVDDVPPLFCIHPAGGIAWCYRTLAQALDASRSVVGIQAPALDPAVAVPASIDALADDYIERMRAVRPHGPYHLLGWSLGGIIAQAMAARLAARGVEVGLVASLDAYPSDCWRAQPDPGEGAALRALLAIAGYDPEAYPQLTTRTAIVDFLRAGDSALGRLPEAALDGVVRVVTETNRLVRGHHHADFDGALVHIKAVHDGADRRLDPQLWREYVRSVEVLDVPFRHGELTGAAASAAIAPTLMARMQEYDHGKT